MTLSIITISLNAKDFLRNCLDSIYSNSPDLDFEVIVVDNNSTDGSQEMIHDKFPDVRLIHLSENIGFSTANNAGYRQSSGEFLLFLNSDTIVHEGALAQMVAYAEKNGDIGALGPKILDRNRQPTNSFQRLLNLKKLFLGSRRLPGHERFRMNYPDPDFNAVKDAEWLSGAALMVRRDVFEKVGQWDENFLLYYEDMDICRQISKQGYRVTYYPRAEITHLFGQTTKNIVRDYEKIRLESMRYYFRKNSPLPFYWLAVLFLKAFKR